MNDSGTQTGPSRPLWWLAAIWLGLGLFRVALNGLLGFPFIFDDELEYWLYAHQLLSGQWVFHYAGAITHYPAYVYPLFVSLVLRLSSSLHTQYLLVRTVDAFVISTVVFPVYRFGVDLGLGERRALWAALMSGLVSGADYASTIMAENLFYPLSLVILYLLWRSGRDPRPGRSLLLGLLTGVGILLKPQGLFFIPLGLVVAVMALASTRDPRRIATGALAYALGLVPILSTRLVIARAEGYRHLFTLHAFMGFYRAQGGVHREPPAGLEAHYAAAYAVILLLVGALLPLVAIFGPRRIRDRGFWTITILATVGLVLYFSRNTVLYNLLGVGGAHGGRQARAQERYLFEVLPLWFLAAGAQFGRGLRSFRAWGLVLGLAGATVALAAVWLPDFFGQLVTFDAPGLTGYYWLSLQHPALILPALILLSLLGLSTLLTRRPYGAMVALVAMCLTWYPGIDATTSLTNAQAAAPLVPWIRAQVPSGDILGWDQSTVNSGIMHTVEFWRVKPWRGLESPRATGAEACRTWVLTRPSTPPASGTRQLDGYALLPPPCRS